MKIKKSILCPDCGRQIIVEVKNEKQKDLVKCDCGKNLAIYSEVFAKLKLFSVNLEEEVEQ